ncbi:MAG: hypothetical protein AB1489_22665 [Acidobacteriota bacterium]
MKKQRALRAASERLSDAAKILDTLLEECESERDLEQRREAIEEIEGQVKYALKLIQEWLSK